MKIDVTQMKDGIYMKMETARVKVRVFFRKKWNVVAGAVSTRLDWVAKKFDVGFSTNYPLSATALGKLGITPGTVLNEVRSGINNKRVRLTTGLKDAVYGAWRVTATFLPSPSTTSLSKWVPRVVKAISQDELEEEFSRSVNRNLGFAFAGTILLGWPNFLRYLVIRYLINRGNDDNNGENNNNNSYGWGFYTLATLNLLMICELIRSGPLRSKIITFLIQDTLGDSVISAKALSLEMSQLSPDLKKLSTNGGMTLIDPRPESLKRLVRTKVFASSEAFAKDLIVLAGVSFNNLFIDSRFIEYTGWLLRARILGKDLGSLQLTASGIPNVYLRRVQGHRNWDFLGQGAVYFALGDSAFWLFQWVTGLGPVVSFPVRIAISRLIYKLSIVSAAVKEMDITEADWAKPGMNFDTVYRPFLIDPLLNHCFTNPLLAIIERKLRGETERNTEEIKEKLEQAISTSDTAELKVESEGTALQSQAQAQVLETTETPEAQFLSKLARQKLTKTERAFLRIYAPNLIFFLETFKKARAHGVDSLIRFLSWIFPKGAQEIMRSFLEVLTDDRVDQMMKFLLHHQRSYLIKPPPSKPDTRDQGYTWLETEIKTADKLDDNDKDEIEVFDIRESIPEISAVDLALFENLILLGKDGKTKIIDEHVLDEADNPDLLLAAYKAAQYTSPDDPSDAEARAADRTQYSSEKKPTSTNSAATALQTLKEDLYSIPIREILRTLESAKAAGPAAFIPMFAGGVVNKAKAMNASMCANIPGGGTTVQMAAIVAAPLIGAPAVVAGATVVAASAVARNADAITAGAAVAERFLQSVLPAAVTPTAAVPAVAPAAVAATATPAAAVGSAAAPATPVVVAQPATAPIAPAAAAVVPAEAPITPAAPVTPVVAAVLTVVPAVPAAAPVTSVTPVAPAATPAAITLPPAVAVAAAPAAASVVSAPAAVAPTPVHAPVHAAGYFPQFNMAETTKYLTRSATEIASAAYWAVGSWWPASPTSPTPVSSPSPVPAAPAPVAEAPASPVAGGGGASAAENSAAPNAAAGVAVNPYIKAKTE